MGRYKFSINAYFTMNNWLEIQEQEKELFEVEGKKIILKSLNEKAIKDSEGIRVESEAFDNLDDCIRIAKKVYSNFLLRLNLSHISYVLDKSSMGNFCEYYTESDAELYKEIIIIDESKKDNELYGILEVGGSGCTHFKFDKLLDISLDEKIKNSLLINNYRKYLCNKELNSKVENTLISASIEMLIDEVDRPEEELNIIKELTDYLDDKYKETKSINYKNIKDMIENNKHKSIRSLKNELVEKYSTEKTKKDNLKLVDAISKNRTKEVHTGKSGIEKDIWANQLLFDVQYGYMKDLFNKENN